VLDDHRDRADALNQELSGSLPLVAVAEQSLPLLKTPVTGADVLGRWHHIPPSS
jgi:hypothetical protein